MREMEILLFQSLVKSRIVRFNFTVMEQKLKGMQQGLGF